ncbi:MSHA biogenesis protein MshQ [Vibrio sp. D420a]|uniref:DUF6701 domain-containing protein n=1 Tax=Vibrio sp. D420a TaxID=2836895 RepID=UPI002555C017|nr:DUF6701 domain-containing protein [Vibrio sp. D420a]MDK9764634.1 MSHA biogenesis protein MshQ [Vibrio sp. D420a]
MNIGSMLFRVIKNTTQLLKFCVVAIVLSMISFVSMADDFSPQQCSNLKRQDGFSIAFTVPDPNPVTVTFTSNNSVVKLWSSVAGSNAKIIDSNVNPGERVLLVYKPTSSNGKQGNLIYKLDTGSGYTQQQPPIAIFITGGNGTLQVSGDTVVVECADGEQEPDPIPDLQDVHYEFGSIEGMDCTHGCNLLFQKSYENPIVFLMSTIDPDDIVNSVPTKASVATIWDSKKGATIESESMPGTSKSDRMSPIYYFVTEPGRLKFYDSSGGAVYGEAGVKRTDLAQCTSGCDRADDWEDIDYQLGNITDPVIMAQVQGKDSKWATTAIQSVGSTGFDLSLERGRQGPLGSGTKDIAYLVVPEFHGKDEDLQSNIEFYQGSRDYAQSKGSPPTESIGWSCENNKVNLHQNFSKFGVIVNKQSRVGSHGGWLRYCKQFEEGGKPTFTFAFDEDVESLSNRKHGKAESIGYFAFEIPETELPTNVCNLFPEPIQSWSGVNSELYLGNPIRIDGWSQDYIDRYVNKVSEGYQRYDDSVWSPSVDEYLLLGFDHTTTAHPLYTSKVCNGDYACDVGNGDGYLDLRKVAQANILPVPQRSTSHTLRIATVDGVKNSCRDGATPKLCSYSESGKNIEVVIEKDLANLTINKEWVNDTIVRVKLRDNLYIENMQISSGNNVELVFPKLSTVTFGTFHHQSGSTQYIFEPGTQVNIRLSMTLTRAQISQEHSYPVLYAPNGTITFHESSIFRGFILADHLIFNQGSIEGAVTARKAEFHSSNVTINKPDYSCPLPPIPQGELVVTPIQSHVLTCEAAAVEFRVKEKDSDATVTSENGDFIAKAMPNANARWCEEYDKNAGSFSQCSNYGSSLTASLVEGKKTLYLSSNQLNKSGYEVSGEWNGEDFLGDFKVSFVPYKFDVDPQQVVAGNSQSVTAKVMSCDIENSPVSQDYIGKPDIQLDIESPSDGKDDISLLTYEPEFIASENGETQDLLTILESGQFRVTLSDSSFECSELSGCPESGIDSLSGSFIVKSRPWKFAVCTDSDSSGTSSTGDGFAAAGEKFDVYAKPIRYTDDATICNDALVTENYLKSDASVAITHTLDTPTDDGSVLGSLNPNSERTKNANSIVEANKGYKFENLKYSEVGSFNFIVTETGSFYGNILGGFSGSKAIGRFYPKYFQVIDQNWSYAGTQTFNYMNQNFEQISFDVEALSKEVSINGGTEVPQPIQNYQYFDSKLQTSFSLYESELATRFISPSFGNGVWSGSNQSIGHFSVSLSGDCGGNSSFCVTKVDTKAGYEDGPYNLNEGISGDITDIRLAIEDNIDPVEFWSGGDQLSKEPDIRFGRIDLDDVGGNSGAIIAIPLRAEYWNGSQFVVNEDDRTTNVVASTSASSVIWSGDDSTTTTATLDNGGAVTDGESRNLTASQGEGVSLREQVQLWQSMSLTPWLRYNWDSDEVPDAANGEQDPSTVVTFGIYRGNDRVIYRGESGLTGQ